MTKRVFNMGGGAHSDAAYTAFENAAYGSCVANATSLAVSAGSGMSVRIAAGDGIISTPSSGKRIQSDAIETVTISAANATYPRIDSVVVYIDSAVQPTTTVIDNVNGILKFAAVAGTPAANPTAPTESMVQAAIGAGNRYMVLADVKVPNGATSMNTATFTDRRKVATMVDGNNIAKKAVKAENIDLTTMPGNKYTNTKQDTGQKWVNEKTIFRQVFTANTRSQGNVEQIIDIGLPKTASLTIIKVEGGIRTGVDFYPIEYINPNAPSGQNSQLKVTFYNGSWQLRFNAGNAGVLTIIIYYTE